MPCEECQVQFTVFRRKRCCAECKRYYCSNCLVDRPTKTSANQVIHGSCSLCVRCLIFTKRPLLRNDLLQLKPKDLIFYLQSKQISTAGCVEKDELIGLVLNHVRDNNANGTPRTENSNSRRSGERRSSRVDDETSSNTPFRSLKQSCQNFFSNITENIQDTFSAFDDPNQRHNSNNNNNNNKSQDKSKTTSPRVSTRELPTYASGLSPTSTTPQTSSYSNHRETAEKNNNNNNNNNKHELPISPTLENITSYSRLDEVCLCSDNEDDDDDEDGEAEETAAKEAVAVEKDKERKIKLTNVKTETAETEINVENAFEENSSQSSFEELGAIGGLSDESSTKTPADSNSGTSNNLEQWHILETPVVAVTAGTSTNCKPSEEPKDTKTASCLYVQKEEEEEDEPEATTSKAGKILTVSQIPMRQTQLSKSLARHHSEGFLELKRQWQQLSIEESPSTSSSAAANYQCQSCKRCGKHKTNLKQQIDRMRRQLESAHMSEVDIKKELNEFLEYLERRTKSLDEDDVDTERSAGRHSSDIHSSLSFYDDNAGIHVYAVPVEDDIKQKNPAQRRFISLHDFDTIQQLETLTVKQLKEVLMLNRVDYKGCVEKQELLERVERLWKNLKSSPALDQLPTDELCKICMDAPIECVILECGHMASCTNCGKVLSECPICRQYIVRVVRFFRA